MLDKIKDGWRVILGVILMASMFYATPAWAAEPLFHQVGTPEHANLPAHITASQPVILNRKAWQSSSISIDLFGENVIAIRDRVERHSQGFETWVGHVQGNEADMVTLTTRGNVFAGSIRWNAENYELSVGPHGKNLLLQLDMSKLPPEDAEYLPDGGGSTTQGSGDEIMAAQSNVTQDLLMVYNQGACDHYSTGCPQVEARIVANVSEINTIYMNSGIDITLNLVGMAWVDYSSQNNFSTTLSDLRSTNDGQMDEVHNLRNQLGADLVSMLTANTQYCGIGYVGSGASTAFSVVSVVCSAFTVAHELGHNQGAYHDRVTSNAGSSTESHYGYRRCNNASLEDYNVAPHFRTIMSYSCTSAARVGHFSNPNINYLNVPTGIDPAVEPTNGSFNTQQLNSTAVYVSGFRATVEQTPAAPSDLSATASSATAIDLSWTDNANNETTFIVQTSPDGVNNWITIASLPDNSTGFNHADLNAETTYFYRVQAQNSSGSSAWTAVAQATTPSYPPITLPYLENFDDNQAQDFASQDPAWSVTNSAYHVNTSQDPSVTVFNRDLGTPANLSISAQISGQAGSTGQNAFIVFDYVSPTEFKYAGAFFDDGQWRIGHVNPTGVITDLNVNEVIALNTNYHVRVFLDGTVATLYADGVMIGSVDYGTDLLDGYTGLGVQQAQSQFDDFQLESSVPNTAPTANAGTDQTVTDSNGSPGESVTLDGSGSTDSDGIIASYSWSWIGGNTIGVNPIINLPDGNTVVTLTVTDNDGATDTDTVSITVNAPVPNTAPNADAGTDKTVADSDGSPGESVTLDGSGSTDSEDNIASYAWSWVGGNTTGINPTINLPDGNTVVTLTVTDDDGATGTDTVSITVSSPTPQPPSSLTAKVQSTGKGKKKVVTGVELNWIDNSNEDAFIIERCKETGKGRNKTCNFAEHATVGADTTTFTDDPGESSFKYRVKARNGTGDSGYSNTVKI